ncbi:MAG: HD domain-containing protein [Bacteroidia bacterium]|nr:HD domain-containing protein [Bacteroidia bacterium]
MTKTLLFNDPIYGFISVKSELVLSIIEHPYFQRLRRIRQLGMTHLVYSGAHHTRFHHALGAMYLLMQSLDVIRLKGNEVTEAEAEAAAIAVLLHDIGHGPFSHALEYSIVPEIMHEELSALFMNRFNKIFNGKLSLALEIFRNTYHKKFLHQLVSSQLDVDRIDYLNRDSFFTGVSEGVISYDRIIKMLNVHNNELVVDAKGILSVEKFIIARRLMYWAVYLHKTVLSAELLMVNILKRAKEMALKGEELFATPPLKKFLVNKFSLKNFIDDESLLDSFAALDDYDVFASIKVWENHPDHVLSKLCSGMVNRKLFKIEIGNVPFAKEIIEEKRKNILKTFRISENECDYFISTGNIVNHAYDSTKNQINILFKDGTLKNIVNASDLMNISALSVPVEKHYLCYIKS